MSSSRQRRTVGGIALVLLLTLATTPLVADEPDYPHGEWEDDCSLCHEDTGWTPVKISPEFKHGKRGFPLRGAHKSEECRACHTNLEFDQASDACVSCHVDPHRNEFGPDCARCHSPRSFIDRRQMARAHVETRFPLRGTHNTVDCEDCHQLSSPGNLQWVKTPVDCVSCHLDDYQSATAIDHVALNFPTTCEDCHTPTVWGRATTDFDHDGLYFPIFSGVHRNRWNSCSTCHVNPSDINDFSCFGCHPHSDPMETGNDHSGVGGYMYDSQACYSCHRDGRAEDD